MLVAMLTLALVGLYIGGVIAALIYDTQENEWDA